MLDVLRPFDDAYTREESIVIQFENCLYAYNYAIINYLLENNYEQWAKLLPGLRAYKDEPKEAVYTASFLYSSENLISKLSNDTLTYQEGLEILNLIDDLLPYDDTTYISNLGIGLSKITTSKKIKKIRIFSKHFNSAKLHLIGRIFEGEEDFNKAVAYEDTGIEICIKDHWDEVTTVFMEDVECFYDNFCKSTDMSLTEKVFFFPHVGFNILNADEYEVKETSLFKYAPLKYRDLFNELESKEKCQINIFSLNI